MGGSFRNRAFGVLAYLALVAAFSGGVWWVGYAAALDQLERRGRADLALAADRLTSQLQRYRELAVLLADHPDLQIDADPVRARTLLRETADRTGSLDVIVLDAAGRERFAAAETAPQDHAGTPYFERAMDGALGVHHLVSDRFDGRYSRRAFLFAAPMFSPAGPVQGAVVVVADVDAVESAWRGDRPTMFFTDEAGVIFVSNRSELIFRARDGDPARAAQSPEYPAAQVTDFVAFTAGFVNGHEVWRVDGGPYVPARALHLTLDLPVIEMTGEVLLDVAPARQIAFLQASVAAALCLAFGALLFLATERRRTLAGANARLEERVANRTAELIAVNTDLRREVQDRTAAEARLKKAQADLVQAGKLSALGQMSAGISHELNQPLMAIRSFAENAEGFLQRGKPEVAAQNLSRISDLARRMGRIIRNLRAFSRHESEPLSDVDICTVVETVLEMSEARAHQAEVTLIWAAPPGPVLVRGGEVRLQQVLLNLVGNAIDAMEGRAAKQVTIALATQGDRVELSVHDTGPGLSEPEKIFDPFYTTKQIGAAEGMGLGLSISYGLVQSFGGSIKGRNHAEGGAVFTVELDAARKAQAA
ncbi:sensor histidine kinase [Octadecabacter sp. SW4]|uniref:sensor histidine kinase n=1 Tax=Octadecabacter sp. SW4 TaxID=2602067 RepID=UPI0011C1DBD9|nr:ATP-binding protein [Octadecabacter sp. SW4]QEE35362.1 sensor histidine kinase [Octadecabacter sp. SW4]